MWLILHWHNTRSAHGPSIGKAVAGLFLLMGMAAGCAKPAGVIFPPPAQPIVWPGGEEPARIRYVGQLMTEVDLKPAVPFTQRLGKMFFGRPAVRAMVSPFSLCTDGANRLFVADSNAQVVHMFDLKSRRYERWRPTGEDRFSQPVGVAWDPAGRLYVADSVGACVHVFDARGRYAGTIGEGDLNRPAGLAFDPQSRRLFVADVTAHQIVMLSPEGELLHRLGRRGTGPGEFNFPTNLVVDNSGRLYVSDTLNFRIQQFDPQLQFVREIGSKGDSPGYLSQPKGLAADSDNHLYIVDAHFEAVQIFNSDGALLLSFGQEGRGPGEFWLPAGIYIDPADRIWVADAYNRRVQVFDYLGEDGR
jgi:DNA-binding beta-propeller fold protein YncE